MSRSHLNHQQTYKLLSWLDTPERRVQLLEVTDDEMSLRATRELGMAITAHNISGARRTLGLKKRAEAAPKTPAADLTALEELLAEQNHRIHALEHNTQALLDRVHTLENNPQLRFSRR
jgi:hypothetical protein